jgi:putative aldouronate transport system substrate-binding protein
VFTQDYAQWQSTGRNDGKIAKVGFSIGWSAADRFGELYEQYVAVPPLKYSAASTTPVFYSWDNEAQNYADNKFSLSSKAKENEKIAAIKFIDQFYDPIISMQVYAGGMNPVDNCIRQNPDGTYEYISSDEGGKSGWESGFMDQGGYYIADYLPLINPNGELEAERAVYKDQEKLYNSKTNIYPQTFMKYTTADTQTMAMSDANIANLTSQWALWVVGQGNIETGWNAYVKSINDAGLQQNLQIRQRAFDTYVKQL